MGIREGIAFLTIILTLTPALAQGIFDDTLTDAGFWEPVGGNLTYDNGVVVAYGFAGGGFVAVLIVIVFGGFLFYKYKYQKKGEEVTGNIELFGKYNY